MRKIKLTQGKWAMVDDEDYGWLSQWRWHAIKTPYTFYVVRNSPKVKGRQNTIRMHRQILTPKIGQLVDHINHNGLDNRKENLRFCGHSQNQFNKRKWKNTTSKFKGVSWQRAVGKWRGRWKAQIRISYKLIYLGVFINQIEAAQAYDCAAKKYFKNRACTNKDLGLLT